jgi:hypothetical protein
MTRSAPETEERGDVRSEIAALDGKALASELLHEAGPQSGDPLAVHPALGRPIGKSKAGQRRDHQIERHGRRVVWIRNGKERDQPEHLEKRPRPAVRDDQRRALNAALASGDRENPEDNVSASLRPRGAG